jgi:DNA-binding transcriptional LysR family regulator
MFARDRSHRLRVSHVMNLQHLRYLAAFAEHRTLTDAAETLGISQPAISRALHELQEELRCPLFQRAGRRLELTAAGQDVLKAARRALAAIDDIRRIPGEQAARDVLRIATLGAMAAGMSALLERFLRLHPDVRVQVLHLDRDDEMPDMLRRRDVEIAYCAIGKAPRGLAVTPMRPLKIVLASPIGSDLPDRVTFAALHNLPMICPARTEERRRLLDDPCERAGATLNCVIESSDTTTFLSGIQAGIGSALMWDVNAAQATGIEVRRFEPEREIAVGLIHHRKPSAIVRALLDQARRLEREAVQLR